MRWTKPQEGETRTVRRFAWVPVVLGTNVVWLEHYDSHERFVVGRLGEQWERVSASLADSPVTSPASTRQPVQRHSR